MTDDEEASFVRACTSSHNVAGLADKIYLAYVMQAIGAKTDE